MKYQRERKFCSLGQALYPVKEKENLLQNYIVFHYRYKKFVSYLPLVRNSNHFFQNYMWSSKCIIPTSNQNYGMQFLNIKPPVLICKHLISSQCVIATNLLNAYYETGNTFKLLIRVIPFKPDSLVKWILPSFYRQGTSDLTSYINKLHN